MFEPFNRFFELANGSYTEMLAWQKASTAEYLSAWQYTANKSDCERKLNEIMSTKNATN